MIQLHLRKGRYTWRQTGWNSFEQENRQKPAWEDIRRTIRSYNCPEQFHRLSEMRAAKGFETMVARIFYEFIQFGIHAKTAAVRHLR